MSRRDTHHDIDQDPAVAAELAALEAVLAGDPPTGELEAELAGLVREVREQAPSMPLALRERLDRSVSEGFLGNRAGARKPRLLFGKLTLGRALTVAGGLAAVLVALVVARGPIMDQLAGGEEISMQSSVSAIKGPTATESATDAESSSAAGSSSESAAKPDAGTAAEPTTKQAAPQSSTAAPGTARKVERAVTLSLRVGLGKLQDASDGVVRVTQGVGGYVDDSQVSAEGRSGDAAFTLRIPTAKLDDAIAQLSKLGHVSSLNQSSQDITSSFVSVGDKLSDARAERAALLRALSKAQTSGAIASLRERIRVNRADLASLKGQLDRLRSRADMSTIEMTVAARRSAGAAAAPSGGWTPGDAAGDALRVLEVAAGVVIVAAAALLPLGLVVLLAVLAGRATRRRRREHALDRA